MEEIRLNHLTMKPCKEWDIYQINPYQLVQDFLHKQYYGDLIARFEKHIIVELDHLHWSSHQVGGANEQIVKTTNK